MVTVYNLFIFSSFSYESTKTYVFLNSKFTQRCFPCTGNNYFSVAHIPKQCTPKFHTNLRYTDKILKKFSSLSISITCRNMFMYFMHVCVSLWICVCVFEQGFYNYIVIHVIHKESLYRLAD